LTGCEEETRVEGGFYAPKGSDKEWRIRVGDYRVVYTIDDARLLVEVNPPLIGFLPTGRKSGENPLDKYASIA